jgi:plastocyanin
MKARLILLVLLAAAVLPADAQAAHYVITMANMAYGRAPAHLRVGDTIEWKNDDMFRHTATVEAGAFNVTLAPGASAQVTLESSGIFNVLCRYHPGMALRLKVAK